MYTSYTVGIHSILDFRVNNTVQLGLRKVKKEKEEAVFYKY